MGDETKLQYPFGNDPDQPNCDPRLCPQISPCPGPSVSPKIECGGGSLANPNPSCVPCQFSEEDDAASIGFGGKFLGCSVIGFNGRIGFNNSESSVSIDLGALAIPTSASNQKCKEFVDDYGTKHNCFDNSVCPSVDPNLGACCEPDGSCSESYSDQTDCENAGGTWIIGKTCADNPCFTTEYTGQLGHIYTFRVGQFCFRGILTDHQYIENDNGYRYKVNLTDGRQVLANVAVILNQYIRVPIKLKPNLINVLYEIESSVGDNTCGSGKKCEDFGKSGNGNQGMFLKKAIEGIDGKAIQLPITGACLTINVSKVIDITPPDFRVTSTESNVLELVTLACEEAGYDFYVAIVGYEITVFPINNKYITADQLDNDAPLFKFLSKLSENNRVVDKEYGQELTFNKSKKIIVGDNMRYLTIVDVPQPSEEPTSSQCIIGDPGSIGQNDAVEAVPSASPCIAVQSEGA